MMLVTSSAPTTVRRTSALVIWTVLSLALLDEKAITTLAFQPSLSIPLKTTVTHSSSSSSALFISNIFNQGSDTPQQDTLPRDVKEAVTKCRASTQEALQKRLSRMTIEFPVGTKFGVEPQPKTKNKESSSQEPTLEDLQRSDRELARLFVDMFQPVGGDRIAVAFSTVDQADAAKQQWKKDFSAQSNVLSMDNKKSQKKQKKKKQKQKMARGFAAKLAADIDDDGQGGPFALPPNTEVALFVAPGPKELVLVEKICQQAGMGTLVILLNARLDKVTNFGSTEAQQLFQEEFEPVFYLGAAPQDAAPGCLLHRAYPGSWVMARKPGVVGQPKTVLVQPDKPTPEECAAVLVSVDVRLTSTTGACTLTLSIYRAALVSRTPFFLPNGCR